MCSRPEIGEAIDEFVGARVAKFLTNQTLQIGVVGTKLDQPCLQFGVFNQQLIARAFKLSPMAPQGEEIARAQRTCQAVGHESGQDGAED